MSQNLPFPADLITFTEEILNGKVHFLCSVSLSSVTEAVVRRYAIKKVSLEISQNSQENTCASEFFLIKLQVLGLRSATLLKRTLWHRCFPVNFAKFLRTPFLTEHLRWLLLVLDIRNTLWSLGNFCWFYNGVLTTAFGHVFHWIILELNFHLAEYPEAATGSVL